MKLCDLWSQNEEFWLFTKILALHAFWSSPSRCARKKKKNSPWKGFPTGWIEFAKRLEHYVSACPAHCMARFGPPGSDQPPLDTNHQVYNFRKSVEVIDIQQISNGSNRHRPEISQGEMKALTETKTWTNMAPTVFAVGDWSASWNEVAVAFLSRTSSRNVDGIPPPERSGREARRARQHQVAANPHRRVASPQQCMQELAV